MKLIRSFKERNQTRREEFVHKQAEDLITLSDFDNTLFIAFQGTPLMPIKEEWTSKEIMEELNKVRQNFINAKIKELC